MSHLILDEKTQEQLLRAQREELELRSKSGTVIGYFVPLDLYKSAQYQWANSLVTDVELEQARKQSKGRTTQEILHRLRSAGK